MGQIELLSPAGGTEQLRAALDFGADAVYFAHRDFNMRAGAENFDDGALTAAVKLTHERGKKAYITLNTLPHPDEMKKIPHVIELVSDAQADAFIVSDAGVFSLCRRYAPQIPVHISVQAGIVNADAAKFWHSLGASRAVLARELTLGEISAIRAALPREMELEAFVHGAMCISQSGRCLLSDYMTGRDANRGDCAQSCRWRYALCEEKRPGEYFPVYEDEDGAYILNADDLNMAAHIDKLSDAGIYSFKIEGRAKSAYYTAAVTYAYRAAIDEYYRSQGGFELPEWIKDELDKISHRRYSTGFYFGRPTGAQTYKTAGYERTHQVVGVAAGYRDGRLAADQRGRFYKGDALDCMEPHRQPRSIAVRAIYNERGEETDCANHAAERVYIDCAEQDIAPGAYLRRRIDEKS